ncbi:hypothetical protein VTO42DRAFT_8687 [Malbranchea cinnamomea]
MRMRHSSKTAITAVSGSYSCFVYPGQSPLKTTSIPASDADFSANVNIDLALSRCPGSCGGERPDNWTVYHDVSSLNNCDQPMLLDFAIHSALDDPMTHAAIRACTADNSDVVARDALPTEACVDATEKEDEMHIASQASENRPEQADLITAVRTVQNFLRDESRCDATSLFSPAEALLSECTLANACKIAVLPRRSSRSLSDQPC